VCAEDPESGLIAVLGNRVETYNRSLGEIFLKSGSRISLDGADDGALRIQGRNLSGVWCDEVGLWHASQWERAWKVSVRLAVRKDPALIVATGTPKMGHPLVALLVEDDRIPVSRLKTSDNVANLTEAALEAFYDEYAGTTLGKQELDGEWIMALEGDLLKRAWWNYYPARGTKESDAAFVSRLPKFQMVLVSVDTPLKDKESNDFVAIQVWGVDGANRYLLDALTSQMGYDAAKRAVIEKSKWARRMWKTQHRTLIENAGFGVELIIDLKRDLGLVEKISPGAEGNKGQRAFSAASDLETGHCFLPGRKKDDLSGPDESCPSITHGLVEEAALFQMDGSHHSHDDQVDAWSQAMNWLRSRQSRRARTWSSFKQTR
jgi:predicted phage terminase large subunit-like protein